MTTVGGIRWRRFRRLAPALQGAYLMHSAWPVRCDCGRYGNPWPNRPITVITNWGRHTQWLCQPAREVIP